MSFMILGSDVSQSARRKPLDIVALVEQYAGKNYELHTEHINPANVRSCYTRAAGPYLWDVKDESIWLC